MKEEGRAPSSLYVYVLAWGFNSNYLGGVLLKKHFLNARSSVQKPKIDLGFAILSAKHD